MAIKAADVSNPAKPLSLYLQWVDRIMEEFYQQGEKERAAGLPISPYMDRQQPKVAKCQTSFIEFICVPLFTSLTEISEQLHGVLYQVQENLRFWQSQQAGVYRGSAVELQSVASMPHLVPSLYGIGRPLNIAARFLGRSSVASIGGGPSAALHSMSSFALRIEDSSSMLDRSFSSDDISAVRPPPESSHDSRSSGNQFSGKSDKSKP